MPMQFLVFGGGILGFLCVCGGGGGGGTLKALNSLISGSGPFLGSGRDTVGKCTGPKWSKMVQTTILVKMTLFQTGFYLAFARPKWTKMVHFGPFWPEEVHFGPFRSANRTLAIPDFWPYFPSDYQRKMHLRDVLSL